MSFANKSIEKGNPLGETFLESKERKKVFILFFSGKRNGFLTRGDVGRLCMLISLVSSLLWRENDEAASLFYSPKRNI